MDQWHYDHTWSGLKYNCRRFQSQTETLFFCNGTFYHNVGVYKNVWICYVYTPIKFTRQSKNPVVYTYHIYRDHNKMCLWNMNALESL